MLLDCDTHPTDNISDCGLSGCATLRLNPVLIISLFGFGWVSLSGQRVLGARDCHAWVNVCLRACMHNT